jgi:cyclic beta-1,2-glucan synthetase
MADQLESLARQLAESHVLCDESYRSTPLRDRLQELETLLRQAYRYFAKASEEKLPLSYADEWLLDNFYLVQQSPRQIRKDMPKGYYRQLPKLSTPGFEGHPRIYVLAREMIRHCGSRLDPARVRRFVQAYQSVTPLMIGELWALPTMLRLGTLENLVEALVRITGMTPEDGEGDSASVALSRGESDDDIVANSIMGLRTLATRDWKAFFERSSHVERVLRRDPANVYASMDFDTRDHYRKIIEELARGTHLDEEGVARKAIDLAQMALKEQGSPRIGHVGFYLLGSGREQLEEITQFTPSRYVRLSRWLFTHPTFIYLGGIALLTLAILSSIVGYALVSSDNILHSIATFFLVLVPSATVAVNLVNWLITLTVPPRVLPKMDFLRGIPSECRTMVVIPALLTDANEIESLLQQVELHYLGNADPHVHFALLTDFTDAPNQHMPGDQALLELAKAGIQTLNIKYSSETAGHFFLFYRDRKWNPSENCWMGWERKRGKLTEFNRLILSKSNELDEVLATNGSIDGSFSVQMGNLDILPEIKYIITLDADTSLPPGSARRLVATLAHPLNRAEFDPDSGAVVAGYTVLQPRLEIRPTSANRSLFTRLFSGDIGLDLYTRAVSEVYQDFFGEGVYAGKGIYDVTAFERCLAGRVPQSALLSHDLFEGIHGRTGLVTDVTLYEDYPPGYIYYARRLHRWVRGDWQLLPWLLPRVPRSDGGRRNNDLSVLDRWKILDNLRRSLLAPTVLGLLVCGWLWLPGATVVWALSGLLVLALPLITGIGTGLIRRLWQGVPISMRLRSAWEDTVRWLLALAFLIYESLISLDAIATTLVRLAITRRRLLQWTTSAHTIRLFDKERKLAVLQGRMRVVLLLTLGLAFLVAWINLSALPVAMPFLLVWLVSPQLAHWISQPLVHEPAPLSTTQHQELRSLALRTWLYFEQFVGPDDLWLPPDHFQEDPRGLVAHRTSPTNLGLMLVSTLASFDLGYLSPLDLILRLRATLDSVNQLERYRGHFFNWYDTRTLNSLHPRYVSTVDSGNLAACLLALRQGCLVLPQTLVLRWERWQGLLDALSVLNEILNTLEGYDLENTLEPLQSYLVHIHQQVLVVRDKPDDWAGLWVKLSGDGWQELNQLLLSLVESCAHMIDASILTDLRICTEQIHRHLDTVHRDVDMLLPWLLLVSEPPALFCRSGIDPALAEAWMRLQDALPATLRFNEVAAATRAAQVRLIDLQTQLTDEVGPANQIQEARTWFARLSAGLESARMAAEVLVIGYNDLEEKIEALFQAMDFRFLFDRRRRVFHIGYNVDATKLDANHYDLLASEARLASLVAIAKGDVFPSHWLYLGRPITQIDGAQVLLSWGGSMFEYLMPLLLMRNYGGSLLDQSYHAVINHQIAYAQERDVPWGISESGYYAFDASLNYQYRSFGVKGLGLKRGLAEDLVISPYASLLALSLRPQAVMENITRLRDLGMIGRYGFYEAIDYTHSRVPPGEKHAKIHSYMVHHQGMILLMLANYLQEDSMVHRFHADPRVKSMEFLLQERVPEQVPVEYPHPEDISAIRPARAKVTLTPWRVPLRDSPQAHFISNGRYGLLITGAGGGFSRWRELDLTRWRADSTLDKWGTWVYVQDHDSGALWSAGYQPTGIQPQRMEVLFHAHKVEYRRIDQGISLHMEVTVPPDDDVEIRRISLANLGGRPRRLRVTSYGEVTLIPHNTDWRHPAFNKLFVESEFLPEANTLMFNRRQRSAKEEVIYMGHLLVMGSDREITSAYESDRGHFLGRGRTPRTPEAIDNNGYGLSGITGATLDPIMSLSQEIDLEPYAKVQLAYVTLAAGSRKEALGLVDRYQAWTLIDQAFDRARFQSELELRQRNLTVRDVEDIQKLLSVLLYPHADLRADPTLLANNTKGQAGLWAYGISGDYPILLVLVNNQEDTALVRKLLQAHSYWRSRRIKIDLVILNQREIGYDQQLHNHLKRMISHADADTWLNKRGGIFLLLADQVSEEDRVLLKTAARAILDGEKGSLTEQLDQQRVLPVHLPPFTPSLSLVKDVEPKPPLARPTDLLFDNGLGGFSPDGREYVIYLKSGESTPAPWINVIANPHFGFIVSEAGLSCTWAENSGENRLTPWRNDPVSDEPSEALYLRDEETATLWSPTPLPSRGKSPYLIRHGPGYSVFEHHSHGLKQRMRVFAVQDAPVKLIQLHLENSWSRNRRITATYYAEWVLGTSREITQQYIVPEFAPNTHALLARNPYNAEFAERVAFLAANKKPHGLTADRAEFLEYMGSLRHPAALSRVGLAGAVEAGLDPCAAMQLHIELAPGESKAVHFLLGEGADRDETLRLIQHYQDPAKVERAWEVVKKHWDGLLDTVTVRTPDPAMNLLLNRWLLYQTLSCRLWGRSAHYQSSGAFGYRDQLQDVMALVHIMPDTVREHILRAAHYQFEEGDVLHWWHPPSGRGVRTRFSDDLLWLPYVTANYIAATGDDSILAEDVPFLRGDPLQPEEEERYGHYEITSKNFTLYEHCRRAIERGSTSGAHGLPLIGSGDWNDGMNRVGIQGQGESVWMGWFLYATLTHFAPVCELMEDDKQAAIYHQRAEALRQAIEANAWDGNWYRRAYYDDGTPLGSATNTEGQIDSIAQSWAILSGAIDDSMDRRSNTTELAEVSPKSDLSETTSRARRAMESVAERLVRPDDQLILLFTPPFDKTPHDPGYIKGYPPGIRENGGQYTHAALWAVWAFAKLGEGDLAEALFRLLNPIYHADTPDKVARYRVEPYVVAADVYSITPHIGRGGWTWYTGSAAWMYRLGLEAILGLHRVGKVLRIDPCIPKDWPEYELIYRNGETTYQIRVENQNKVNRGVKQVTLDGQEVSDGEIPLLGDGQCHKVHVLMG